MPIHSYDTLLNIDRVSSGVRLNVRRFYFPKRVKEKIKGRSISIRLAQSILILPVPFTTSPTCASLSLVRVYLPIMFMPVFFGMPKIAHAAPFDGDTDCNNNTSTSIFSLLHSRARTHKPRKDTSRNQSARWLVFHYVRLRGEINAKK